MVDANLLFLIGAAGFILILFIGLGVAFYGFFLQLKFYFAPDRKRGWKMYFPGGRFQWDIWRGNFTPYGGPVAQHYLARMRKSGIAFLYAWLLAVTWFAVAMFPHFNRVQ